MSVGSQENAPPFVTSGATNPMPQVVRRRWRPQPKLSWATRALFVALLVVLSILFLYPFIWLISATFKPRGETFDNALIPHHWAWNFTGPDIPSPHPQYLFNVAPVGHWLFNSFWISFLGAGLTMFVSAMIAFAFAYFRFPLRNFLFAVLLATMMLPGEVTMIPVYLLWNHIGRFTLAHPWLPHIGTGTQYPLWVPNMFGSAFYIFLQRQFFLGIPRDYFEAARMDGDGYFSMFRRIALPLAKPALIVTFIFEVQAKWFDLMTPLIYLRDAATFTVPLGMKNLLDRFNAAGGGEGDYQVIMAGTLLLVIPMVILFAAFQKYFIRGIATQGRKG
ncbi:MAG TPA: carbohydrate ABC transporter permease [Gaiellaceae bacterium]|nr:carbohydrate ABC transporter permease [Gaiellaceae bacterium]